MRLTDEQRMLRDVARDFARTRLAPYAAERDCEARFPAAHQALRLRQTGEFREAWSLGLEWGARAIQDRFADGDPAQLRGVPVPPRPCAAVDVIVGFQRPRSGGSRTTSAILIVHCGDPVGAGLVASLASAGR
jgi:hypothetical protein